MTSITDALAKEYPSFYNFLLKVYKLSPTHKNRMEDIIQRLGDSYKKEANVYFKMLGGFLESKKMDMDYAVNAYIRLCKDVFMEEFKFTRNREYSAKSFGETAANVYHNEEVMSYYMLGLAVSQYMWKNHYLIFNWFNGIVSEENNVRAYLEIGPGHGLYLLSAVKSLKDALFNVVDISETSLQMSKDLLQYAMPENKNVNFEKGDVFHWNGGYRYDFIAMGEVLEHVENPAELLRKTRNLLNPSGTAFVTTCANCPAIDHLHLFGSVDEIRGMISACGFEIREDMALNVEGAGGAVSPVATINYAALLCVK